MQSDSPAKILETKYPPSLMLESLNTMLLDREFAYSDARVISLKEANILRPPKGSLGVDTALDSELLKLPATLFISLIFISPLYQFPLFLQRCHPRLHGIYICVFSLTFGKRAITDRSDILLVIPLLKKNPNLGPCFKTK